MIARDIVFQAENSIDVEPDATTLYDLSRYKNNGTMPDGQPDWVQLPSGLWVLAFDGSDDRVTIPDHPSLDPILGMTVEIWIYANDMARTNYYIHKQVWVANAWAIYSLTPGTLWFQIMNNAVGTWEQASTAITAQAWHHVVGTADFVNSVTSLYLDGAFVALDNTPVGVTEPENNAGILYLGRHASTVDGYATSPCINGYVLTPGEILQHYESTKHWFGVHD